MTMQPPVLLLSVCLLPLACAKDDNIGDPFQTGSDTAASTSLTTTAGTDSATGGSTSGSGGTASSSAGSDSGPKFDVAGTDLEGSGCQNPDGMCGCSFVDIVFVVDNSVSMGDYQNALSIAFPGFADAIVDSLPPGTNVHVGVTSTTMGMSNSGSTSNCSATGDNGQPQDFFYQTPDTANNGINGAQGRLYDPGGGMTFYAFDTDAGPTEIQNLKTWFSQAAQIGESGSQVEMASAAAGWVADPANNGTNAGFLRDEGAVLVVFFVQDEADQTPWTIDGMPGGTAMINKLAAAKQGCGGSACIVGGGFVNENCLPQVALADFFGGMGEPAITSPLPDENLAEDFPDQAAEEMNQLLRDNLAQVIGQKCLEIPPVG